MVQFGYAQRWILVKEVYWITFIKGLSKPRVLSSQCMRFRCFGSLGVPIVNLDLNFGIYVLVIGVKQALPSEGGDFFIQKD